MPAGRPAAPAALCFTLEYFFHGKIWRLQEASRPLPPPTHSRKHFLWSVRHGAVQGAPAADGAAHMVAVGSS